MELDVVRPLLVFEKLLPHEQHRDARRGQADRGCDTGAAAAVPRARVAGIAESRDSILAIEYEENPENPLSDLEVGLKHVRAAAAKLA